MTLTNQASTSAVLQQEIQTIHGGSVHCFNPSERLSGTPIRSMHEDYEMRIAIFDACTWTTWTERDFTLDKIATRLFCQQMFVHVMNWLIRGIERAYLTLFRVTVGLDIDVLINYQYQALAEFRW